ncbi:MAG TPA: hypothetical protein VFU13_04385 [Steroidobacteraceae bacterium]|nr:hypothetical protein [Steroidobacteraceae bacterium]
MKSIKQQLRRARLAVVALGLIGATPAAFAVGTDFGTDITNTASVNYSVSGVPQTAINSSPTGNSTPGTPGVPTTFEVDKKIIFIAEETDGAATVTSPGLTQVVTVFRVTNTSNGSQDYGIVADNTQPPAIIFGRADAFDMSNFTLHATAPTACDPGTMTTPSFAGEAAVTHIEQLPEDDCVYVFVRSDTPVSPTAANGLASTIRLVVTATTNASNGVTAEAESGVADDPTVVDVVFAEAGVLNGNVVEDGISMAFDQYFVGTLTVTKTAAVISDGFSPAGQAKAIPGATVEYTITVQNNGLVTSGAALTEAIPANTTYVAGSTTLNGAAVADVAGTMPYVSGGAINSPAAGAGVINPGATAAERAVVRFRVTIN